MYDRCPKCNSPMMFHGITSIQHIWGRWTECTRCGTLTVSDANGTILEIGNKPPKDWALARNEEYAGDKPERLGQDDVRRVPKVQPHGTGKIGR